MHLVLPKISVIFDFILLAWLSCKELKASEMYPNFFVHSEIRTNNCQITMRKAHPLVQPDLVENEILKVILKTVLLFHWKLSIFMKSDAPLYVLNTFLKLRSYIQSFKSLKPTSNHINRRHIYLI